MTTGPFPRNPNTKQAKAEAEGARSRLALAVAESRELREELAAQTQRYEIVGVWVRVWVDR